MGSSGCAWNTTLATARGRAWASKPRKPTWRASQPSATSCAATSAKSCAPCKARWQKPPRPFNLKKPSNTSASWPLSKSTRPKTPSSTPASRKSRCTPSCKTRGAPMSTSSRSRTEPSPRATPLRCGANSARTPKKSLKPPSFRCATSLAATPTRSTLRSKSICLSKGSSCMCRSAGTNCAWWKCRNATRGFSCATGKSKWSKPTPRPQPSACWKPPKRTCA